MSTEATKSVDEGKQLSMAVFPQSCLVDDNLNVIIEGLQPLAQYTIAGRLTEGGIYAASYAHFIADSLGCISTSKLPSLSGSYQGIDSNGLLWSMDIVPGQKPGRRIMKKDVTKPFEVELSVYPGHINPIVPVHEDELILAEGTETSEVKPIIKQIQHRFYMADDVKRIEIRDGNIRGTLFLPPGDGPFPATIDMFGTAGGLLEFRSALLASRGIASLALAFFAFEDLPKDLSGGIHMDYFEEAVDWLYNHPMVTNHGVGVMGVSAGAYLAVLCAELFSKVKAVVSINGAIANYIAPMRYKGKVLKEVLEPDWAACEFIEEKEDAISFKDIYGTANMSKFPNTILKPELSDASLLMVVSGGDINTHPMLSMMIIERLNEFGKGDNCELLFLDNAGHLVEPPHTMHCYHSYHKAYSACFAWGGEKVAHARAQVKAWAKIQQFLKSELSEPQKSKL
jgi:dienelactone hydrolase